MFNQSNVAYGCLWLAGIIMVGELTRSLFTDAVDVLPIALAAVLAVIGTLLITFASDEPEPGPRSKPPGNGPG